MNSPSWGEERRDLVGKRLPDRNKKQYIELSGTRKNSVELSGYSVEGTKDK